jgi:hypothetical protein
MSCKRCGGEVVQKNRLRLVLVGCALLFVPLPLLWWWDIILPVSLLALIGCYLVLWATFGRGRWCRGCKRFDGI